MPYGKKGILFRRSIPKQKYMSLNSLREHSWSPSSSLTTLKIILLTIPVLSFILWKNDPLITEENRLLELAQGAFLLLACFMHGSRVFRLKSSSLDFLIHAALALLTYSFALRELDFDQFGSTEIWAPIEQILRFAGMALCIGFLVFLVPRIKQIFYCWLAILALPSIGLTISAGLFFVAGWPFDKQIFSLLSPAYSRFIEEVLELNGCVLLFAASLANSRIESVPGNVSAAKAKDIL
jgi:hypothetical protein